MANDGREWIHNVIVRTSESPEPAPTETEPAAPPEEVKEPAETEEPAETPEKVAEEKPEEPAETPKTEKPAEPEKEEVVACTAADLTRTFENNVLAGNLEYRNKSVRVTGTIKAFGEIGDRSYVVLNGWSDGSLVGVRCFVDSLDDIKALAAMRVGQRLTMEGICTGLSVNVDVDAAHIATTVPVPVKPSATQPKPVETLEQPAEEEPAAEGEETTPEEETETGAVPEENEAGTEEVQAGEENTPGNMAEREPSVRQQASL